MSETDGAKPNSALIAKLTEAQLDCLRLVHRRKTAKQIARALNITHYAVEMRLKSARRNLGVSTTAEAVDILEAAMREGYGSTVYGLSDIPEMDLNWAIPFTSPPIGGDSGPEVMTAFSPAADLFPTQPPKSGMMDLLLGNAGAMPWQQRLLLMAAMAFGAVTIVILLISIIDGLSRLNPT